jgi:general secretion pathway protein G
VIVVLASFCGVIVLGLLAAMPTFKKVAQEAKVGVAKEDLERLGNSIERFRNDVGRFPTKEEGLRVLLQRPTGGITWFGPYVSEIPLDPWEEAYVYEGPLPNDNRFKLFSYGPDRKAGGQGLNADLYSRSSRR